MGRRAWNLNCCVDFFFPFPNSFLQGYSYTNRSRFPITLLTFSRRLTSAKRDWNGSIPLPIFFIELVALSYLYVSIINDKRVGFDGNIFCIFQQPTKIKTQKRAVVFLYRRLLLFLVKKTAKNRSWHFGSGEVDNYRVGMFYNFSDLKHNFS